MVRPATCPPHRKNPATAANSFRRRPQMEYEQIRYELAENVLTLTMNRPDRLNAWTPTMLRELLDAFDRADADDDVRVVIITGAGRGFCAGADLEAGGDTFDYRARGVEDEVPRDGGGQFTLRVFASKKPVIAAINGPAVGVGATMTLPMDVRLASTTARMGFVFTRRGIVPEAATSWFPPAAAGISQAVVRAAPGPVFLAGGALAGGLVRSLYEPDDLLPAAHALAREIVENTAPVSVALARRLMWDMLGASHPMEAHRADSRAMLARGQSGDVREGVASFLEKRSPSFPDRVSDGLPEIYSDREEPAFS